MPFSDIKFSTFADDEAILEILREKQRNETTPVLFCCVRSLSHRHTNGFRVLDKVTIVITVCYSGSVGCLAL